MSEFIQFYGQLDSWLQAGRKIAIATVTKTWGSSPRRPGALMAVTDDMKLIGSVSAGCVEAAVIEEALAVIKTQRPKSLHFGVSDASAWEVGLACGGEVAIFVQPYHAALHEAVRPYIVQERSFTWVTHEADGCSAILVDGRITYSDGILDDTVVVGSTDYVARQIAPPLTLILIGGHHIAVVLAQLARVMGYRVSVVDPRSVFATPERFGQAELLVDWPKRAFEQLVISPSTAIAVLTHDPKIDDSALELALRSPAFYVGALGSKTTQAARRERLLQRGLSESQLARLHGPIGLNIGAGTPEEIAVSILGEIIQCWNQRG